MLGSYYSNHVLLFPYWESSMSEALATHVVSWAVTIQPCEPSRDDYVRISIGVASDVDERTVPPTISLDESSAVAAIGGKSGSSLSATDGVGRVPVGALLDSRVNSRSPDWVDAHLVGFDHVALGYRRISGDISFASIADATLDAVSTAVADTLSDASASDPGCPTSCSEPVLTVLFTDYDVNGDGLVTAADVHGGWALRSEGVAPTVDVFSGTGTAATYWPGHDGVADSYGAIVGFSGHEVQVRHP